MTYHSLKEWLEVFPKDLSISVVVKTYGQLSCVTGLQRLRTPDDEGDEKRLESKVYNIEYIPDSKIIFDTDYVRYYKDEKDDIITDLWRKLYCTDENAERMEKIFKYRSGITVKPDAPEKKESKPKLDPRINKRFGPLTCFQTDEAKAFLGQYGYFTDNLSAFEDVDRIQYSKLVRVVESGSCFYDAEGLKWAFFLPEAWVATENSGGKFRAYSLKEFTERHIIGEVVIFRKKGEVTECHWQYSGFETHPDLVETMPGNGVIFLGPKCFRLSALFDDYEMLVWDTENPDEKVWQPFGVKE